MMDFMRPTAGAITLLGQDSIRDTVALKRKVGYLSGNVQLYRKWTGQEHFDFVRRLNGGADRAAEIAARFDFDPTVPAKNLSSGNRQKLGIIMAFMTKPDLLILDEPTATLDPLLQNEVYELLREVTRDGATVFMSSHNLPEVDRVCSRVSIIREGRIVATESIKSLKEKRLYTVQVDFEGSFDRDAFAMDGVQVTKETKSGLVLSVSGSVNALVKKLAQQNVHDLSIEHASLDEIFLEFYEGEEKGD